MRAIIRSAAPLGYRPAEVREMVPLDWLLVVRGHNDANKTRQPGADAPTRAEVDRLVELYG